MGKALGFMLFFIGLGMVIGLLVSDGRLRLNETAPVPTWQRSGDPRGEITLKQLLQEPNDKPLEAYNS